MDFKNVINNSGVVDVSAKNKVLNQTYQLLALSLLPTALGAFVGLSLNLQVFLSGIMGMVIFLVGAFGLMYMVEKNKNSASGVGWLMGFTFFMGLMLTNILSFVLSRGNGAMIVMNATIGTALIFFVMAGIGSVIKKDLSFMGNFLMIGVLVLFVASIANIFLKIPALMLTISAISILLFSLWIMFDVKRIIDGGETNYISATLSLYLNLYNIFTSLLQILGIFGGDGD